jgi:plasmid stability protein
MPNLSIKDVPEHWAAVLRARASRHHRSLQGELMSILEQAVYGEVATSGGLAGKAATVSRGLPSGQVVRQGWKTVEQVAEELRRVYPEPLADQTSSIDLVRGDRDNR